MLPTYLTYPVVASRHECQDGGSAWVLVLHISRFISLSVRPTLSSAYPLARDAKRLLCFVLPFRAGSHKAFIPIDRRLKHVVISIGYRELSRMVNIDRQVRVITSILVT